MVDTGVYGIVRHPMLAIWLESWIGVIALIPVLVVMIFRIRVEESTLKAVLPGYLKYMKNVKYRLLPFVW